jgi:ABC-type enterochelin transport system ATPase subunit
MIEVRGLSKRYGETVAVDDLSFDVTPGIVTGFLGPNGAGKSTGEGTRVRCPNFGGSFWNFRGDIHSAVCA